MHSLLDRIGAVKDEDKHPDDSGLYKALMGDISNFTETFKTAENNVRTAEAQANAAKAETVAALAEIAAAHAETRRAQSELAHAQSLASDATARFDALSADVKQMKSDWREEKRNLVSKRKEFKTDPALKQKEFAEFSSHVEGLIKKIKIQPPAKKPSKSESKSILPIFDVMVAERGPNDKIKRVTLTPRGIR
jgi:chromosome segregation ATPase